MYLVENTYVARSIWLHTAPEGYAYIPPIEWPCMLSVEIASCVCRFDNVRIPRENLLNAVADVTAEGKYVSPISDPDQVGTATVWWLL